MGILIFDTNLGGFDSAFTLKDATVVYTLSQNDIHRDWLIAELIRREVSKQLQPTNDSAAEQEK